MPPALIEPDKHDFAPRVAIAWKPIPKHSLQLRASYGIYYNPTVYNQFASRLASQPPFANTASLVAGLDNTLTIQNGLLIPPGKLLNTWAVDPNYQVGYAQSWTFTLQQDLIKSLDTRPRLHREQRDSSRYRNRSQSRRSRRRTSGQQCNRIHLRKLQREFHL